jgi:hypothetical protein
MHNRFLSWFFVCASLAFLSLRAQSPGALSAPGSIVGGAEQVLAARVTGTVQTILNGQATPLRTDDRVPQAAKIVTGANSSVVLVFSNGATTQLGSDTELIIEEFLQDPFASTVRVAELAEEPSRSRTRLSLNRGELVGNVKKLKHAEGSSFTVSTPVGAAGIRGTTFRIVFRPVGAGQAFGALAQPFEFSITTLEGDVGFQQGTPGVPFTSTGPTPVPGIATAPVTGTTTLPIIGVPTGQEFSLTVTVAQNPAGQLVVTRAPVVTGTMPIAPANAAQVAQVAQQLIGAITNTSFAPPRPVDARPPTPTPQAPRTTPLGGDR